MSKRDSVNTEVAAEGNRANMKAESVTRIARSFRVFSR